MILLVLVAKPKIIQTLCYLSFQCLRRYRDTREAFPHLVNAGKYSTTFFVVIFSALNALVVSKYKAEGKKNLLNKNNVIYKM